MADGKRPGGLTALAVLNFVFAGLGLLGLLAVAALLGAAHHAAGADEFDKAMESAEISSGVIYGLLALMGVRLAIMLAAGVGYLKQAKWGRTLGNLYAILALADTAIGLAMLKQGFSAGTLIGLVYPVLTLALVNTTFKDDLVN